LIRSLSLPVLTRCEGWIEHYGMLTPSLKKDSDTVVPLSAEIK